MITRLRLFFQPGLLLVAWLVSFSAFAVEYTLPADIGNGPFANCSGTGPYTCAGKVEIKFPDTVVLSSAVTLNVNGEFKVDDFAGPVNLAGIYTMNVFATKGHIDGDEIVNINLTASGDITLHKSATVIGDVTSTGGTLNIDPDSTVDGTCDPDHPQCNGGGGGGLECTITKIAADNEEFKAIAGNSDSNVIAVGKNGSIYNYDGTTWSKNAFSSNQELRDVIILPSGEAWAVGKKGKVVYFNGTVWTTMATPSNDDLRGVWAISNTEVWVVGKKEAIYLWNGISWTDMSGPGAGQVVVDNNAELKSAWGDTNYFFAVEKDGDLYRYTRPGGPWNKITTCSSLYDMDIERTWGDGTGKVYLAGKNKGPNPDEAGLFLYDENFPGPASCTIDNSSTSSDKFNGVAGNGSVIYTVGKGGLVVENTTGSWVESTQGTQEIKDVWVSNSDTAYYAAKGGFVSICTASTAATLDHFVITPATSSASTCLTNAITIDAINPAGDPVVDYANQVNITLSRNHGNWSKNTALGTLSPDPDTDDNGAVSYTFDLLDISTAILDLSNKHAETITITVNDPVEGVTTVSGPIQFSENTFIITEDPVQIAGRPQAMTIAMWTDDTAGSGSCGIDPNYNSAAQSLETSVTRSAGSPASNAPFIGLVEIPDASDTTIPVALNFSVVPGQASFSLLTTDVGQYRLNMTDTPIAGSHSDVPIVGISNELTVRPFGLAVTAITGLITNTGNTTSAGAIFAIAGTNFSAIVEAVLWDSNDDTNNDGALDTGVYADNVKAPSYAWDTLLKVPSPAMGFTPTTAQNGVQGNLINGGLVAADFTAGTASPTNLQYDEVGSFTLQSSATDYLGTIGADFVGDDIIVGRFRPASFALTATVNGIFANSCNLYTYIGENFSYDVIHPSFQVTAMNGLAVPTPTTNYTGAWGKLDDDSVNFTQPVADLTQNGSDGSTKMAISYTQDAAKFTITDNTDGSYTFEFANDSYAYDKDSNSEIPDFDSDISLAVIDVTDPESVSYNTGINLNPAFINLRFGRVKLINAHGSELSTLTMPMLVEYLDSPGLYTINSDDDCTTIATVGISDNLSTPGSSTVTVTNTTAVGGDLGISLTAPGTGITGYIDVTPDLTASLDSWLKYDWTAGAGAFTEDPTARATFGIYTGNDVNIYKSQVYQ